jgi:superfamily II DNA or RNA helicase
MSTNQMNIQLRPHQERGVAAMAEHDKGQIVVPTGGGKTLKMIYDALRELQSETPQTIVVVAPRILLAEQLSSEFLEFITNAMVRVSTFTVAKLITSLLLAPKRFATGLMLMPTIIA